MHKYLLFILFLSACGGSSGSDGAAGAVGLNGTNGTAGLTVSSEFFCGSVDGGSGTSLTFKYQSVKYTTGDRDVNCSIADSAHQYSAETFYRVGSTGATTGSCILGYDLDGASGGFWTYTSSGGTNQVVYTDGGSGHNGYLYNLAGCVSL